MAKKIFIIAALLPFIVILLNMTVFKKHDDNSSHEANNVSSQLSDINTLRS